MSMQARTAAVAEAHTMDPLVQKIYLSLLGTDVWRQYREGVHPSLLLEMYANEDHLGMFLTSLLAMLPRLCGPQGYGSLDGLSSFIDETVDGWTPGNQLAFSRQGCLSIADIATVMGVDFEDPRARTVNRVVTVSVDATVPSWSSPRGVYLEAIAKLWFTMCDRLLEVNA